MKLEVLFFKCVIVRETPSKMGKEWVDPRDKANAIAKYLIEMSCPPGSFRDISPKTPYASPMWDSLSGLQLTDNATRG